MTEEQNILEFCIEFTKLTFNDNFKLSDGVYKSNCGRHTIHYVRDCPTISRIGNKSKVVEINNEINDLSYVTRLFFCLWSFMILKCGKDEERADLVTITLMQSVWKKLNLSDKDFSNDIFQFMVKYPSLLNEIRLKNIINFLVFQKNESLV
jgi:hypothetical protein